MRDIVTLVVGGVIVAMLFTLALIGYLTATSDKPIPDVLVATPPSCLTLLGGILIPRPNGGTRKKGQS